MFATLSSTTIFADEVNNSEVSTSVVIQNFSESEDIIATINLSELDFNNPYVEVNEFIDENGNTVTITNTYVPDNLTKGSSTNNASSGTWTSLYVGAITMSYKFDLSKSGSSWKISNAREHLYGGLVTQFTDPVLRISRVTSTSSYPAEVYATVHTKTTILSSTCLLRTSVNNNGVMTTYWNRDKGYKIIPLLNIYFAICQRLQITVSP